MSETAPPAPAASAAPEKPSASRKAKKPAKVAVATKKKPAGPSVSELIVQAASSSKERGGVSLAAFKKALAAAGYDVEKNNSRIKLGIKSLVSKGTLVQTKGTGASGSFKLNKKASSVETKPGPSRVAAKTKATGASKKPKKATGVSKKNVKTPKNAKKSATRKSSKSPKKPKAVKPKKVAKSPAKTKAIKPKAAKAKVTKPKTAKPKKASPKKR
ncbi:PREDICTED: histone H1.1 [Cercocebus atys]|uniref:histone H1.1 n=1 Tax=Cercocebus atys TaxID=9531 RepID=UPI0005F456E3|nr:PREDICTED: histone H1.1 [Cercocebus atys]